MLLRTCGIKTNLLPIAIKCR